MENPHDLCPLCQQPNGTSGEHRLPAWSHQLDFEGELAIIIGKAGRYISKADAWGHIAGYACYNDGSVRDFQYHTHQFTPGKNFPDTGAFGPWMMTPDELGELGTAQDPDAGEW